MHRPAQVDWKNIYSLRWDDEADSVLPLQAELRARQQSQGAGSTQPAAGASSSGARLSMPPQVAPGMQSELQAALERRRKSAAP